MSHETRTGWSRYRWEIAPPVTSEYLGRFKDLDPLVVQLLHNRDLVEPHDVRTFLKGAPTDHNPFGLHGMNNAVTRIRRAIRQGERIAVYGDFDVDGVTSTALLIQVLEALGATAEPYIPHRVEEGYGLHTSALDDLAAKGTDLVISVDCGIRAVREVQHGHQLGLDLIITDHHEPPARLPPALAVINPKVPGCRYPHKDLPGVGLAFKLAQALLRVETRVPVGTTGGEIAEDDLLDLVALGIVADLASLLGENRTLVRRGLKVLNHAQRPGVRALMEVAGVQPGQVTSETIGYVLGPRLNAAGRLDHAMLAYRLLTTRDPATARALAEALDAQNRERQRLTEAILERALAEIEGHEDAPFLMVGGEDFVQGVVGLVASRLVEQFYKPALVLEIGQETSHGSARSIPEFNIVKALDQVSELLDRYGGHAAAAGLTVATDKLDRLRTELLRIATQELASRDLAPVLKIDAELPLARLSPKTFQSLTTLEPFGVDNPVPLLLARDVTLRHHALVGDSQDHLRLKLESNRIVWDAMAFGQGHWATDMPERIDIVYTPRIDVWNGQERLRLNVKDLRPASRES